MMDLSSFECVNVNETNLKDYLNFYTAVKKSMPCPEWLGDFSVEELKNILLTGGKIWIFKHEKEVVCSLMFIPASQHFLEKAGLRTDLRYGECGPIMVAPKYVGNGLQRQMLKFLDDFCSDNKFDFVLTTTHPDNLVSIKNFQKCGYSYNSTLNLKRGSRNLYLKKLTTSKVAKYIFLEGLPKVGKTTILNVLKERQLKNFHFVDEIVNTKILNQQSLTEMDFIENEDQKLNMFQDGIIVVDRGPISLLSYSQAKAIIEPQYSPSWALKWFGEVQPVLSNALVFYLFNDDITLSSTDKQSPYGTEENQKLLRTITEFNIKKYCPNYVFKKYTKNNLNEVLDEIID